MRFLKKIPTHKLKSIKLQVQAWLIIRYIFTILRSIFFTFIPSSLNIYQTEPLSEKKTVKKLVVRFVSLRTFVVTPHNVMRQKRCSKNRNRKEIQYARKPRKWRAEEEKK